MYNYLIIDDEDIIREGTIKKLESLQNELQCIGQAANGKEGIEQIARLHPDIVILDMQMPVMDGTELLPYLTEHFPNLQLIVISGFQDFNYMKHAIAAGAIDYILKPFSKEAIQECAKKAISRIVNSNSIQDQIIHSNKEKEDALYEYDIQTLKGLILGHHTDTIDICSKKLQYINNTHSMILLTLHTNTSFKELSVQEWLNNNGFMDLALFLTDATYEQTAFLILFLPDVNNQTQEQLINKIVNYFQYWFHSHHAILRIGISQKHASLHELNIAFHETSIAMDMMPISSCSFMSQYYNSSYVPQKLIWVPQDEFLFRIEAGMVKEVQTLFCSLFQWFLTLPDCTLGDAKSLCDDLSSQCRIMMNQYMKIKDTISESNSMRTVLSHIFCLKDLENYYTQFFTNITTLIQPYSVYAVDTNIEKIKIYIQRNYAKALTQDFIASLFYLNRSYLSTLFKNQTGEKFIDYLNKVRIKKAKEQLHRTNRKTYLIAKSVGYDNVKYFYRVFKKTTGITPEQYRKLEH